MYITKRNGKKEEFDIKKIETSIINTAKDINYPLTGSDIKILTSEIHKQSKSFCDSTETTNVYEIRTLIYMKLMEYKFNAVAEQYMKIL